MIELDLSEIDNHIDVISEIDVRNARCRAVWTQKFYTGAKCFDVWAMDDRARFESRLRIKLARARGWMIPRIKHRPSTLRALALSPNVSRGHLRLVGTRPIGPAPAESNRRK
jgi:hypothetical protein